MQLSEQTKKELGRLVTVPRAAKLAGVSEAVIWRSINTKRLDCWKGAVLIDPKDVEKVIVRRGRGRPKKGVGS